MPNEETEYPKYSERLKKSDKVAALDTTVLLTELSTKGAEESWTDRDIAAWTGIDLRNLRQE
jgi:hypothetical protein